ncbi:MAG: hypothetical protein EBQ95_08255 [Gammaproteobacteria bacterium]|nr:hypothetical protein [Gammaproteobacteria bacterium]
MLIIFTFWMFFLIFTCVLLCFIQKKNDSLEI